MRGRGTGRRGQREGDREGEEEGRGGKIAGDDDVEQGVIATKCHRNLNGCATNSMTVPGIVWSRSECGVGQEGRARGRGKGDVSARQTGTETGKIEVGGCCCSGREEERERKRERRREGERGGKPRTSRD